MPLVNAGTWPTHLHPKVRNSRVCLGCNGRKVETWLVCRPCYTTNEDGLWISEELAVKIELAERFDNQGD